MSNNVYGLWFANRRRQIDGSLNEYYSNYGALSKIQQPPSSPFLSFPSTNGINAIHPLLEETWLFRNLELADFQFKDLYTLTERCDFPPPFKGGWIIAAETFGEFSLSQNN